MANFTVAVTPRVKDGDGWRDGDTSYFRVNVWRTLAEHVTELAKGDRVLVYGTLRQRSWQTEDGERPSSVEVQAEEVGASLKWATANPADRSTPRPPGTLPPGGRPVSPGWGSGGGASLPRLAGHRARQGSGGAGEA